MLHHVSLPVADIGRSRALYSAVLQALGYRVVVEDADFVGYGLVSGEDRLAIRQTEGARAAGPGFHLALAAPSQAAVAAGHAAAIRFGATDNGAPSLRPHYGPDYYAAFFIDPDGHRIELIHK